MNKKVLDTYNWKCYIVYTYRPRDSDMYLVSFQVSRYDGFINFKLSQNWC